MVLLSVQKDAVVLGLEPLHAILLLQLVGCAHLAHLQLAILHAAARPRKVHIEVHAVDACARVVLDPQVNVLLGHTILLSCGQVHGSRMTPANGLHKQRERKRNSYQRSQVLASHTRQPFKSFRPRFSDAKAKAAISGKVLLSQLVLLHFQALLQDLLN